MRTVLYICLLLIMILAVSLSVSIMEAEKAKQENTRLTNNLNEYGRANSDLKLEKQELEHELEKGNKELLQADSILRSKNKRISQLERLVNTRILIVDRDTTYIHDTTVVEIKPGIFRTTFREEKSCMLFEGFVECTDQSPKIAVTKRQSDIVVNDIHIRRRWYQFWLPRVERIIESNCGEVEIKKIERQR